MDEKRLTIIIPYYNTGKYTNELLKVLDKQIRDDIEVILIDDGSREPFTAGYDWLRIIRQKNGGASAARNTGIDNAVGEYIAFIDSDDLIPEYYVQKIIDKIDAENFDYCYLSWKTIGLGWQQNVKLNHVSDVFPPFNLCVWNRIYKSTHRYRRINAWNLIQTVDKTLASLNIFFVHISRILARSI